MEWCSTISKDELTESALEAGVKDTVQGELTVAEKSVKGSVEF